MKTPDKPLSSKRKGRDKAEESAPGGTPMARFRALAGKVMTVPREDVIAAEKREKKKKKP